MSLRAKIKPAEELRHVSLCCNAAHRRAAKESEAMKDVIFEVEECTYEVSSYCPDCGQWL